MMNRREFMGALGAAGLIGPIVAGASDHVAHAIRERLYLINQEANWQFEMRLIKETPIEMYCELDPGRTGYVEHVTCLRPHGSMAMAILGAEIDAGDRGEGAKSCADIDGECVFRLALGSRAVSAHHFSASRDLFLAETPEGRVAGIFVPNGTRIQIFTDVSNDAPSPVRIRAKLRTAIYAVVKKEPEDRRPMGKRAPPRAQLLHEFI
jgi:hypothetical protein